MIDKTLGFYSSGNLEFDSKISACIYATKNNLDVSWEFHKDFFNNYNWHVEPEMSLDQLYNKRARELREKYDYIIISYSGGADSHNLLMSFIRQNLFVDEIIVNTMEKGMSRYRQISITDNSAENALQTEHVYQVLPRLKEIEKLIPKTKITVLDLTDYLFDFLNSAGDASWIECKREKLNPINITRFNYIYFSEVRKRFDQDKKIAVVLGVEKPRVYVTNSKDVYMRFTDGAANIVSVISDHLKDYSNSKIEYFYWSPDAADIICKQVYVIKSWLKLNPNYQNLWLGKNLTTEVYRLIHERMYRNLLYTTWNDSWFQADKAVLDWHTEFDDWFITGFKGTHLHSIWRDGLSYVETNASKFIKKNLSIPDGLQMFYQDHKITNLDC